MINIFFKNLVLIVSLAILVNATTLEKKWELNGFSMPESVVTSPSSNYIYVSNVNAKEKGYISRLTKKGKVDTLKWIKGLNNPAGLALFEDKLYVGDGNSLHIIDTKTEKLLTSIVSKEAKGLNDVTISKTGQVFVSDIATGRIFTLEKDKLIIFFEKPEIKHPNGLYVQNNHLFIANMGSRLALDLTPKEYGSLYKINLDTKSYEQIASSFRLGGLDGLVSLDNRLIASSNLTGELYAITPKERVLIKSIQRGIADIFIENNILYVPIIFGATVQAYTIKDK